MFDSVIGPSELKFAELVWVNEPIKSGELVRLATEKFGWKKSTGYTVLKNLCNKDFLVNSDSIVIARITRKEYYHMIAFSFLHEYFNDSVPGFVAAYRDGVQLTREDLFDIYNAIKYYGD